MTARGRWHGERFYLGLHYDLHAGVKDTVLGTRCSPRELIPMLKRMNPDFVQTDCKGHPGYTSWFSKVPGAAVPPKLKKDALKQWRAATAELGLPLHCHYSGIWDSAQAEKHRDWVAVAADGKPYGAPRKRGDKPEYQKMCPRGPYLEKLMIPQLIELIDRYKVDGFWIDGDLWSALPCYCRRCTAAYRADTGRKPPQKQGDADWPRWMQFTYESFTTYVTRYCDAVHAHKPGVLVCSNWLQTFRDPGEPAVPTDWISGDNSWVWGLDGSRCEARFLATRGKPWDIMLWAFYCSHGMGKPDSPWSFKPPEMLMQEAAVLLASGGNVQIYEHPPTRDGQLVGWRMDRLGEVAKFVRARKKLCQGGETLPQIALLHSEHHYRRVRTGDNLMWGSDVAGVRGALYALLENHFGVDILDEWALLPRLGEFPVVVVAEQEHMSAAMVKALEAYARNGGRLLLTGAKTIRRFDATITGLRKPKIMRARSYGVPAGYASVPLYSQEWALYKPGKILGSLPLYEKERLKEQRLPYLSASLHEIGKGNVACIPADIGHDFERNRYPMTREFFGSVVRALAGSVLSVTIAAPIGVDVTLRRQGARTVIHLVNRGSGLPNLPASGAIDAIPPVGPVKLTLRLDKRPQEVARAFEPGPLTWHYRGGELTVKLDQVRIHTAVTITP